jgi:hypothetical protein
VKETTDIVSQDSPEDPTTDNTLCSTPKIMEQKSFVFVVKFFLEDNVTLCSEFFDSNQVLFEMIGFGM